jgi:hypothetical protein
MGHVNIPVDCMMDGPMGHFNIPVDCLMDGPMGHVNTAVDGIMDKPMSHFNIPVDCVGLQSSCRYICIEILDEGSSNDVKHKL